MSLDHPRLILDRFKIYHFSLIFWDFWVDRKWWIWWDLSVRIVWFLYISFVSSCWVGTNICFKFPTVIFFKNLETLPKINPNFEEKKMKVDKKYPEISACGELLSEHICSTSYVFMKNKEEYQFKHESALLSMHLPSYLVILLTNFWIYHF